MMLYDLKMKKENKSVSLWLLLGLILIPSIIYAFLSSNMTTMHPNVSLVDERDSSQETTNIKKEYTLPNIEDNIIQLPYVQGLTGSAQYADTSSLTDYDISFFEHSVFVGDSISVGFETYCNSHSNTILTDSTYFLARVSCSAKAVVSKNATTTHANVVPMYQGKVQLIEDSIMQIGDIQKVFICFGVNDLVGCSPEEYISNIQILVSRIKEKNPEVTIYMISVPCVCENVSTGYLNNIAIQETNTLLHDICIENQWGFINLTEYIMNADYSIRPELSSDGYVHENNMAYDIWTYVLKKYANEGKIS